MKKGNVKMLVRNLRKIEEKKQCDIHVVVGRSEKLVCEDCGYEINPAGICVNMNCSTNENP